MAWSGCPHAELRGSGASVLSGQTQSAQSSLSPDLSLLIYKRGSISRLPFWDQGVHRGLSPDRGPHRTMLHRWQTEEVTEAEEKATYRGSLTGPGQNQGCGTDVYLCVSV